ncbi:MAG TPA: hypothetical protein VK773_11770 [Acidimicrobiales bacterium]|jgi:hypothetical protein|nr:hypothetical protein [Acidimicrobiales bacterium]
MATELLHERLLRSVMIDAARHVAFSVLSLKEFNAGLTHDEILSRQEFSFEAALALRNRCYSP